MKNPLVVPELQELIKNNHTQLLKDFCESGHPAIIAEMIAALPTDEAWQVLRHADQPLRSEIFSHMDIDFQTELVHILRREDVARLMADMAPDDRADLFKRMPEERRETILHGLAYAEREDIRRLSAYEEGTAGSVMTSDYALLSSELTVVQAIERLRLEAPNAETIYYAYVVDDQRKLIGFVSLKDLILSRPGAKIADIMNREVLYVQIDEDQEEVAGLIRKYDLIALPVINGNDALVGIITHDDAIDILTQEYTEDMEKIMAIGGSHENAAYIKTTAWQHFMNRAGWVVILAVLGLVSGFIVQKFEGMLLHFAILAAFMPMLADTGGNTGSQSSTLVVRALALKEISAKDILQVLFKELKVAVLLGLLLGIIAFGRVVVFGGGSTLPTGFNLGLIGTAIAVALSLQVVTATLIGAVLPIIASSLKLDPAVVASPALTTIVDITGLLIFFNITRMILGI